MRRLRIGLFWLVLLAVVCVAAVIGRPDKVPPLGTGDAGFFEIPNIREAAFHDHFPGQPWVANGDEPQPDE